MRTHPSLAILATLVALVFCNAAHGQQNRLQECLSLPANAQPAQVEYCEGIRAAAGYGGRQDMTLAFQHVLKAAEMGYADAQSMAGDGYRTGFPVAQNLQLAAQWYTRAVAQGSASAEYNLGLMYVDGTGVPKDVGKGRQLLQASANQGNADAQRDLARLGGGGFTQQPAEALHAQGMARFQAGDYASALQLFLQAAQAGNTNAMGDLGFMYLNGRGMAADPARAAQWYAKAAQLGNSGAQWALGMQYEKGQGLPDDWVQASQWFIKSAGQGNKLGEAALGRAYEYGIGVPLNLDQAAAWYDKAAAQGDSQSAYFAQYIRNNHGFDGSSYDAQEQAIMAPYRSEPWALRQPPAGHVFRNSTERRQYFQAWANAAAAYVTCVSRHHGALPGSRFTCPMPSPPF